MRCAFFALAIEEEITGGPLLKGRRGHHLIYKTNLKNFVGKIPYLVSY